MSLPRLIGITGLSGVGKDTLADALVAFFGYVKYSLAKPIKELLNDRFEWTDAMWLDRQWKERPAITGMSHRGGLIGIQDPALSPRQLAQWLGTDVGRNIGGEDVWINAMEREWYHLNKYADSAPGMVVPDIRFDNEARRIHLLGGVVIRVIRPQAQAVAAHVSERGVSDELVNVQVTNDRDTDSYLTEAVRALRQCPQGTQR